MKHGSHKSRTGTAGDIDLLDSCRNSSSRTSSYPSLHPTLPFPAEYLCATWHQRTSTGSHTAPLWVMIHDALSGRQRGFFYPSVRSFPSMHMGVKRALLLRQTHLARTCNNNNNAVAFEVPRSRVPVPTALPTASSALPLFPFARWLIALTAFVRILATISMRSVLTQSFQYQVQYLNHFTYDTSP